MSGRNPMLLICFLLTLGSVSMAEGAEVKFHAAAGAEPVVGRYLVTLDASVSSDAAAQAAEGLARSYGGQIERGGSSDARTFAVTMLPSRARSLSVDGRVREVVEVPPPDSRGAAPSRGLTSRQLVPVAQQFPSPGAYAYDGSGNIKAIGSDTFVYDLEGRLVDATVQSNQQSYTYDIYGNRLSATRAQNAVGCLGGTNCEAPSSVDPANNHLLNVTYDDAGNVLTGYDASYPLKHPSRVSLLGRQKAITGKKVSADVIDDRERVTVLMIAEKELTFVVDRHQVVRRERDGAAPQGVCRRVATPAWSHQVRTTQQISRRARSRPLHSRM
jgi:YD repeat-containing protein